MKRSEINTIMKKADEFIRKQNFHLPPFAYWSPEDWRQKGAEVREIVENKLGWDITDFGSGDFYRSGLFLFTIRNGHPDAWKTMKGKLYAEKIMIVEEGQFTPMHFHWDKMEDIINRGGGRLVIELFNATPSEDNRRTAARLAYLLTVSSVWCLLGGKLSCIQEKASRFPNSVIINFGLKASRTLVGEVSMVNDDNSDNRFYQPLPRFPEIEEDEAPLHLLCVDYPKYYQHRSDER